jgi:hypothetical protein
MAVSFSMNIKKGLKDMGDSSYSIMVTPESDDNETILLYKKVSTESWLGSCAKKSTKRKGL